MVQYCSTEQGRMGDRVRMIENDSFFLLLCYQSQFWQRDKKMIEAMLWVDCLLDDEEDDDDDW